MKKILFLMALATAMLTTTSCGNRRAFIDFVKNDQATRAKRDRKVKNNFWESVHTTIYNYEERTIRIAVHEGSDYHEYKL